MIHRLRREARPYPSPKAPVDHAAPAAQSSMSWSAKTRRSGSEQQPGTLWQRKMRTLALRLSKRGTRRDRSGSPMKRGPAKKKAAR